MLSSFRLCYIQFKVVKILWGPGPGAGDRITKTPVLVSLVLTFYFTYFLCFYFWLWACICLLGLRESIRAFLKLLFFYVVFFTIIHESQDCRRRRMAILWLLSTTPPSLPPPRFLWIKHTTDSFIYELMMSKHLMSGLSSHCYYYFQGKLGSQLLFDFLRGCTRGKRDQAFGRQYLRGFIFDNWFASQSVGPACDVNELTK